MLDEGNLKTYSYHSYSTGPYPTCCHFSDCRTFLANFGNFCCTVNFFRKFGRKYISPLKLILEHVLPKSSIKGPKKNFCLAAYLAAPHLFRWIFRVEVFQPWRSTNETPRLGSTHEALPSEKCIRLVTIGYQVQWLAVKQWNFADVWMICFTDFTVYIAI